MTEAQRVWLRLADDKWGLSPDAMWRGSQRRCVDRMISAGLLEEIHVAGEGIRFFVTDAGRKALTLAKAEV